MLGNGRLEAQCMDGSKRLCHIRGKLRKKVWVNAVSLASQVFEESKSA
jgi:translation initiation factor 1A